MATRAPRATPEQFEVMVNFMTAHSCLVHPKLSNSLPSTERDKLWEELCTKLNSHTFGPKKTISQWRRVWTDLKSEVKDKLAELNKKRIRGSKEELLNPCHRNVANLLAKVSSQCAFIASRGITVSALAEQERGEIGIKYEESINYENSDHESHTAQPFVVNLQSLTTQAAGSESQDFVKCEEIVENDSSDPDFLVPYVQDVNSNEDYQSLEETIDPTIPVFNKKKTRPKRKKMRKAVTEDAHLSNLVEAEKEKSNMLLAIADAISSSNENQKKILKIEEERNILIQQRNAIESERNDIFKSLLEHLISKEIL